MNGSFLVSIFFSSLLFLCFFLIRESLLVFITTVPLALGAALTLGASLTVDKICKKVEST